MDILVRGLEPGTDYIMQARAKSSTGQTSQWSTTFKVHTTSDVTAPSPVTSLTWEPNGTAFVATWVRPTTDSNGLPLKDFHHYEVTLTASSISKKYIVLQERFDFSFEQNVALFGSPEPIVDISVKVSDTIGNLSTAATATAQNPIPANITGLVADGIMNSIALQWDASAEDDFKLYEVYMSLTGAGFTPGPTNLIAKTTTPSFLLPTMNSTLHYFKVRQIDVFDQASAGYASAQAEPILSTGLDTSPPDVPTSVTATTAAAADGTSSITVSWTAVTSDNLAEYVIRYSTDEVAWRYVTVPADRTSGTIDHLLPDTNYYTAVASVSQVNSYSAFANASPYPITSAADSVAPSKPSAPTVSVNSGTASAAQVAHDMLKDAGGNLESDVDHLEVHASISSGFTPSTSTIQGTIAVAGPGVGVSGVFYYPVTTAIANLYWKVVAVDRAGNKSTASNQATGTPGLILNANIADATITSAKINDLAANKITAGSGIINNLSVKSSLTLDDINSFIKSGNYDGVTQTGWRLDQSGLVIYNGTISAAALQIQDSANICPAVFSDFEFDTRYYHNETGVATSNWFASTGMVLTRTAPGKTGNAFMRMANASITNPTHHSLVLGAGGFTSSTGEWVNVSPGDYIFSFWARKTGTPDQYMGPGLYTESDTYLTNGTVNITSTSWTRYSVALTVPSGISRVRMYFDIGPLASNTGYDVGIDTIQLERKLGALTTPSPWKPPGMTSVSGDSIITGSIRSYASAAGISDQPAWSLNTQGNMQVGDALVRGSLTVGAGADTTNSIVQSANYVASTTGWIIRGDGTAEFNSTTVRGTLTVTGANGKIQTAILASYPTIFFYNANSSNYAFMNLVDGTGSNASLGINSGKYTSTVDGTTQLRARLWMVPPNNTTRLGHVTDPTQIPVGGQFGYNETTAFLSSFSLAGVEKARIGIGNDGNANMNSLNTSGQFISQIFANADGTASLNSRLASDPTKFSAFVNTYADGNIEIQGLYDTNNHIDNRIHLVPNSGVWLQSHSNTSPYNVTAEMIVGNLGKIWLQGGNGASLTGRNITVGGLGSGWLAVNGEDWFNVPFYQWDSDAGNPSNPVYDVAITRPGFYPLGIKLFPDGTVRMRGTIQPNAGSPANAGPAWLLAGFNCALVPVGYRPSSNVSFPLTCDNNTGGSSPSGITPRCTVQTDGIVRIFSVPSQTSTVGGFDGIQWQMS